MPELENWLSLKKTWVPDPTLPWFLQQLGSEMTKGLGGGRKEGKEKERSEGKRRLGRRTGWEGVYTGLEFQKIYRSLTRESVGLQSIKKNLKFITASYHINLLQHLIFNITFNTQK